MDAVAQLNTILAERYRVEREIGHGGMATVYLARDVRHDRLVALKVLDPELGAVLGVERFLAEIKVTANLQHPNILPLFDSGEAVPAGYHPPGTGLLFYVMPYVEGESLRARLEREKQLPVEEALRIASSIAAALEHAHRHGVIHRDLKPENILLRDGQPLLADFGIALAVSNAGGSRITQTGLSLGTPHYMSPEQATGDRVIDGRSDIYSLGAVTYEMLAGEPPHVANTSQAVIARLLTEEPRDIRVTRPSVPEHARHAIMRALAKLPADRWKTAGEFAAALEGRAAAVPQESGAHAHATSRARAASRLRDPVTLTLAGLTVAALAFAVFAGMRAARAEPQETVRFALSMPGHLRLQPATGTSSSPVAISPDGRTVAFTGLDRDGVSQIYLRSLDEAMPRALSGTTTPQQPFFSPDGQWIGFWSYGKLQKIAVSGGAAIPIADLALTAGASWSRSGEIIVSANFSLIAIPDGGGPWRKVTHGAATLQEWFPWAAPDGRHVLFAQSTGAGLESLHLAVADLKTGDVIPLGIAGTYPVGIVDGMIVYGSAGNGLMAAPIDVKHWKVTGAGVSVEPDVIIGATGGTKAAVSATGSLVFQSGSRDVQLVAVDMTGKTRPLLADAGAYGYPRLSPDGRRLAMTVSSGSHSDVWLYDLPSGTPTRLTSGAGVNERPEWTPDGKRVLFRSSRLHRSSLWWVPADQSGPETPLLASDKLNFFEGVLSPDGRTLIYQMDTLTSDVYYRNLSGDTTSHAIAATAAIEDRARVSPDGKLVAYVSTESGATQVIVTPFPGPGPRVHVSPAGGNTPVWSPDGKRLFFSQGQRMMAATVVESPMLTVTSVTPLFEGDFAPPVSPHANYDVSRDGRELIMLKPVGDAEVMVVHNWAPELRRRVFGQQGR